MCSGVAKKTMRRTSNRNVQNFALFAAFFMASVTLPGCAGISSTAPHEGKATSEPASVAPPLALPSSASALGPEIVDAHPQDPPPPRSPFAYANEDPTDDLIVAPPDPRPNCEADLKA